MTDDVADTPVKPHRAPCGRVGRPRGVKREEAVRLLRLGHSWQSLISRGIPRHTVYEARIEVNRGKR